MRYDGPGIETEDEGHEISKVQLAAAARVATLIPSQTDSRM
jgi:hypothetical protein